MRAPEDDLFRESPMQALHARRTIRSFGPGDVPRAAVDDAVGGGVHRARTAPHAAVGVRRPRRGARETPLLAAIADAWRADLRATAPPRR